MDFDKIYLFIFVVLLVAFIALVGIYILYMLQQKVTSVAIRSADVAFFPMRATAFSIRLFFRMVAFCFDVTLFGLRLFLVSIRLALSAVETTLLMWRVPLVVMISIVQRITKFRKSRKLKRKSSAKELVPKVSEPAQNKDDDTKTADHETTSKENVEVHDNEETRLATRVLWTALGRVRRAKQLLRPDLMLIQKSGWFFKAHKYLRRRAGLEKEPS